MSFRYEMRLSGEGGQGLVLAGRILAEAAAVFGGLNATQSQSYGPEARGGLSRSEVILSDEEIDYPKAVSVDLLLSLTQESFDHYQYDMKPGGIVLAEASIQSPDVEREWRVLQAPILRIAEERLGRVLFANVVAVGMIAGLSNVIPVEALRSAVRARAPRGTADKNLQALQIGLDEAAGLVHTS